MPDIDLQALRSSLQEGGVPRRYIGRLMSELKDHYADLEQEELTVGGEPAVAARRACRRLGDQEAIAAEVFNRDELRSWSSRWPWIVNLLRPVMLILLLPSVPMLVCADRGPAIVRWSASIGLAALLTGGLLFAMARSIFFSI